MGSYIQLTNQQIMFYTKSTTCDEYGYTVPTIENVKIVATMTQFTPTSILVGYNMTEYTMIFHTGVANISGHPLMGGMKSKDLFVHILPLGSWGFPLDPHYSGVDSDIGAGRGPLLMSPFHPNYLGEKYRAPDREFHDNDTEGVNPLRYFVNGVAREIINN